MSSKAVVAIIHFPGTNRERDMAVAVEHVMGATPHIIWCQERDLPSHTNLIIIPGGFSYGDYLRCGAMAGRAPIMEAIIKASQKDIPILGVCNGFQILCEAGLLPGYLMRNTDLKFKCLQQELHINTNSQWFESYTNKHITYPIAHGEGNYQAHDDVIDYLEQHHLIALRYKNNPNGSRNDIAGILSPNHKILGMMPHPENAIFSWQNEQSHVSDGSLLFHSILHHVLS